MASKFFKRAADNLTCPVCYQLYKKAKFLNCHHSYCEHCIERMIERLQAGSKIVCPECRRETAVPAGGVQQLKSNFFINRMVDEVVLKQKAKGDVDVQCDECDDVPVVAFCPDCTLYLCQLCNEAHKKKKATRGHGIVPLEELKETKEVPLLAKRQVLMCPRHEYELKHFCETCEKLVCLYCTTKEHSTHKHDTVKEVAEKHRRELKEATAPLDDMLRRLTDARRNMDDMINRIRQQGELVNKNIDRVYEERIQQLLEENREAKQQLREMVTYKEKAIGTQIEEIELLMAQVSSLKELKDELVKKGEAEEVLSTKRRVIDSTQKVMGKGKDVNTHPVESYFIQFVPSSQPLPKLGHILSKVDAVVTGLPEHAMEGNRVALTVVVKDSNGVGCADLGSVLTVDVSGLGKNAVELKDNSNGRYTVSFVPERAGDVEVCVSVAGQPIKGSPYNVDVQCRDYRAVDKPSKVVTANGQMGGPLGIAFGNDGIWAVADWSKHCVYVFDSQDQLVRTIGRKGSNNGELDHPTRVAFDSTNHLYVADSGNHRVQKFSVDGKYVLQFGGRGSQNGQLQHPVGVTVHNGRVYVAEQSNKRVSVFQLDGQFCLTIGSGHCSAPWDVAISTSGQLLVADRFHHCIYTFSLSGEYVQKFGQKRTGKGQLDGPLGLTTDLYGFILVSDLSHPVSVYDRNGTFIHSFGSYGSGDGQFSYPYGIALSPSGSIYVSDCYNHRIQIFSV